MKDMNLSEVVERSVQIRKLYHNLEKHYHEKEWSVEEVRGSILELKTVNRIVNHIFLVSYQQYR